MTIPAFHPGELNVYSAPGDVADVSRALRLTGRRVMLVPTMGALHEGHLALVRAAKRVPGSVVVVSIFVNPMQFGAGEDLDAYPRTPDDDLAQLRAEGVEIAFTPTTAAMYPDGLRTTVQPGPLAAELEGGPRPTHFAGVLTVVLKLLQIVRPDRVFFGEKDYQQLVLIRQLVADFNLDVAVVGVPTVREADGLAVPAGCCWAMAVPADRVGRPWRVSWAGCPARAATAVMPTGSGPVVPAGRVAPVWPGQTGSTPARLRTPTPVRTVPTTAATGIKLAGTGVPAPPVASARLAASAGRAGWGSRSTATTAPAVRVEPGVLPVPMAVPAALAALAA